MSGENLSQRETLTINNGVYYVDTTVSQATQEAENYTNFAKGAGRFRNVFKEGQTYYMFFAYAKTSTIQTYQIYVGKGFDVKTQFKPGRIDIDSFEFIDKPTDSWATAAPVGEDGILTVNIDFSGWTALEPSPDRGLCQPRTFCKPEKNICVSAVAADDPLMLANKKFMRQNGDVCQRWAVKDLDCPPVVKDERTGKFKDGGCFAFSFTLSPGKVVANDEYHRPTPQPFPTAQDPKKKQGQPDWMTRFDAPDQNVAGQCTYEKTKPPITVPCSPSR
jgi:hypothetical protein